MPWSGPTAGISSSRPDAETVRAFRAAVRYLRHRVRSTREVQAFLARQGVAAQVAGAVIERCRRQHVLDDRAAARLWAEAWARRGYAWTAIQAKLNERGFDAAAVRSTAESYGARADDRARARQAAAAALPRLRHLPQATRAGRVARMLGSRGFDSDLIERVLGDLLGPTPLE